MNQWPVVMLWLGLAVAGCVSPTKENLSTPVARVPVGLYEMPADKDFHYPLFWLGDDGRFAFLDDAETAADKATWANHGTYTAQQNNLRLVYTETECCQFVEDEETMTFQRLDDGNLRVRFRGESLLLKRLPTPVP